MADRHQPTSSTSGAAPVRIALDDAIESMVRGMVRGQSGPDEVSGYGGQSLGGGSGVFFGVVFCPPPPPDPGPRPAQPVNQILERKA